MTRVIIVRGLQLLVIAISAHVFVCLFAMTRLSRNLRNRTYLVMFLLFLALALEAATIGLQTVLRLGNPIPATFNVGNLSFVIWLRVVERMFLSLVTWGAALHITGHTKK